MCPFGMIGVPARREYFGRFKGGYEAKAGSLAGYRSRGNNKKRAPDAFHTENTGRSANGDLKKKPHPSQLQAEPANGNERSIAMPQASVGGTQAPRKSALSTKCFWATQVLPVKTSSLENDSARGTSSCKQTGAGEVGPGPKLTKAQFMAVKYPLDKEVIAHRRKCPDSPPEQDPTRGAEIRTRWLYSNQTPCTAPDFKVV